MSIASKNILIRFDSGFPIGFGHAFRCVALGIEWKKRGHNVKFITRNRKDFLSSALGEEFIVLGATSKESLPGEESTWLGVKEEREYEDIKNAIDDFNADLFVIDHYGYSHNLEEKISNLSGLKVMVIDDYNDHHHFCDFFLNQNPSADKEIVTNYLPEKCRTFLGPEFTLFRDEFQKATERGPVKSVDKVLIFLGGALNSFLPRVTELIKETQLNQCELHVLHQGKSEFKDKIHFHGQVEEMVPFLKQFDLVIGAAGASTWERAKIGVPSVVFSFNENQVGIAKKVDELKVSKYLGDMASLNENEVKVEINKIINNIDYLNEMRKEGLNLVGKSRLNELLEVVE